MMSLETGDKELWDERGGYCCCILTLLFCVEMGVLGKETCHYSRYSGRSMLYARLSVNWTCRVRSQA